MTAALFPALTLTAFGASGAPAVQGAAFEGTTTSEFGPTDAQLRMVAKKQKVKLTVHPQLAHTGKKPTSSAKAKSVLSATVKPKQRNRPVELQRKQGKKWVEAGSARTNHRGMVDFVAPAKKKGKWATYRAVSKPFKGNSSASSKSVSTSRWSSADFVDEFDAKKLDRRKWGHRGPDYQPTSKRNCARGSARATDVSRGTLKLRVMKDPSRRGDRCSYVAALDGKKRTTVYRLNGHVGTQPGIARQGYSFRYGYAAARIKFQPLRGQHGAFWLQPASRASAGSSPAHTGTEIDIVEYFGASKKHPNKKPLTSWIYHYASSDKVGAGGGAVGNLPNPNAYGNNWSGKYHVFSVEWAPKKYVFRIT